jgi:hypothetical protein
MEVRDKEPPVEQVIAHRHRTSVLDDGTSMPALSVTVASDAA